MAPRPYSDRSALPDNSGVNDIVSTIPTQDFTENPSPSTLSGNTTPSPTPVEVIVTERIIDTDDVQEDNSTINERSSVPFYPTSEDIMPYDHSLPDFIKQITNQTNLADIQSLSLRVISTLVSLHRMAAYLPNLRELNLEGSILNSLRDIGCNFKNLQILKVGRCQLESLDGTFGLSSLRELYAEKNLINDVSPCSNLPHIRHIDVSCNRIRNISYAGFLSVCSKLKSIVFTGNPAVEVPGYRKHVRRILPQVETLDGVPFSNDDTVDETKQAETGENTCENSDSSSAEVPDFLSISSSDSLNNLLESEEDNFALHKKNREKHVGAQHPSEALDCEIQEVALDLKNKSNLQAKIIEHKNIKANQKFTSIQKLDKDIENRSKKSNLFSNVNISNNLNLPETANEAQNQFLASEENLTMPSTSNSSLKENFSPKNDEVFFKETDSNKFMNKQTTGLELKQSEPNEHNLELKLNESKFGAIKKSLTEISGDLPSHSDSKGRKLTKGSPVCGNLTAALRNRKKIYDSEKNMDHKMNNFASKDEREELTDFDNNGNARSIDEDEDDLIEKDVLASSQKWRETFRRYRSNNRASWEEEEKTEEKNSKN